MGTSGNRLRTYSIPGRYDRVRYAAALDQTSGVSRDRAKASPARHVYPHAERNQRPGAQVVERPETAEVNPLEALRKQTKCSHAVRRSYVHFSVHNHRSDVFIVGKVVAIAGGLVGVVELGSQFAGIVGVQNTAAAIFHDPHNSGAGAIRGNGGRRAGIREGLAGL